MDALLKNKEHEIDKLLSENHHLAEELKQSEADKDFVWNLWKQLQVSAPDLTKAISLVVMREKEKADAKDHKLLEIVQTKDEEIKELHDLVTRLRNKNGNLLDRKLNGGGSDDLELTIHQLQQENRRLMTELKDTTLQLQHCQKENQHLSNEIQRLLTGAKDFGSYNLTDKEHHSNTVEAMRDYSADQRLGTTNGKHGPDGISKLYNQVRSIGKFKSGIKHGSHMLNDVTPEKTQNSAKKNWRGVESHLSEVEHMTGHTPRKSLSERTAAIPPICISRHNWDHSGFQSYEGQSMGSNVTDHHESLTDDENVHSDNSKIAKLYNKIKLIRKMGDRRHVHQIDASVNSQENLQISTKKKWDDDEHDDANGSHLQNNRRAFSLSPSRHNSSRSSWGALQDGIHKHEIQGGMSGHVTDEHEADHDNYASRHSPSSNKFAKTTAQLQMLKKMNKGRHHGSTIYNDPSFHSPENPSSSYQNWKMEQSAVPQDYGTFNGSSFEKTPRRGRSLSPSRVNLTGQGLTGDAWCDRQHELMKQRDRGMAAGHEEDEHGYEPGNTVRRDSFANVSNQVNLLHKMRRGRRSKSSTGEDSSMSPQEGISGNVQNIDEHDHYDKNFKHRFSKTSNQIKLMNRMHRSRHHDDPVHEDTSFISQNNLETEGINGNGQNMDEHDHYDKNLKHRFSKTSNQIKLMNRMHRSRHHDDPVHEDTSFISQNNLETEGINGNGQNIDEHDHYDKNLKHRFSKTSNQIKLMNRMHRSRHHDDPVHEDTSFISQNNLETQRGGNGSMMDHEIKGHESESSDGQHSHRFHKTSNRVKIIRRMSKGGKRIYPVNEPDNPSTHDLQPSTDEEAHIANGVRESDKEHLTERDNKKIGKIYDQIRLIKKMKHGRKHETHDGQIADTPFKEKINQIMNGQDDGQGMEHMEIDYNELVWMYERLEIEYGQLLKENQKLKKKLHTLDATIEDSPESDEMTPHKFNYDDDHSTSNIRLQDANRKKPSNASSYVGARQSRAGSQFGFRKFAADDQEERETNQGRHAPPDLLILSPRSSTHNYDEDIYNVRSQDRNGSRKISNAPSEAASRRSMQRGIGHHNDADDQEYRNNQMQDFQRRKSIASRSREHLNEDGEDEETETQRRMKRGASLPPSYFRNSRQSWDAVKAEAKNRQHDLDKTHLEVPNAADVQKRHRSTSRGSMKSSKLRSQDDDDQQSATRKLSSIQRRGENSGAQSRATSRSPSRATSRSPTRATSRKILDAIRNSKGRHDNDDYDTPCSKRTGRANKRENSILPPNDEEDWEDLPQRESDKHDDGGNQENVKLKNQRKNKRRISSLSPSKVRLYQKNWNEIKCGLKEYSERQNISPDKTRERSLTPERDWDDTRDSGPGARKRLPRRSLRKRSRDCRDILKGEPCGENRRGRSLPRSFYKSPREFGDRLQSERRKHKDDDEDEEPLRGEDRRRKSSLSPSRLKSPRHSFDLNQNKFRGHDYLIQENLMAKPPRDHRRRSTISPARQKSRRLTWDVTEDRPMEDDDDDLERSADREETWQSWDPVGTGARKPVDLRHESLKTKLPGRVKRRGYSLSPRRPVRRHCALLRVIKGGYDNGNVKLKLRGRKRRVRRLYSPRRIHSSPTSLIYSFPNNRIHSSPNICTLTRYGHKRCSLRTRSNSPCIQNKEGSMMLKKLMATETKLDETKNKLDLKMQELEEVQQAHDRRLERFQLLQEDYKTLEDEVLGRDDMSAQTPWYELEGANTSGKGRLRAQCMTAISAIARCEHRKRALLQRRVSLEDDFDALRVQAAKYRGRIQQLRVSLKAERTKTKRTNNKGGKKTSKDLENRFRNSVTDNIVLSQDKERLRNTNRNLKEDLKSLKRELTDARREREDLCDDNSEFQRMCDAIKRDNKDLNCENNELRNEVESSRRESAAIRSDNGDMQREVNDLKEELSNLENKLRSSRQVSMDPTSTRRTTLTPRGRSLSPRCLSPRCDFLSLVCEKSSNPSNTSDAGCQTLTNDDITIDERSTLDIEGSDDTSFVPSFSKKGKNSKRETDSRQGKRPSSLPRYKDSWAVANLKQQVASLKAQCFALRSSKENVSKYGYEEKETNDRHQMELLACRETLNKLKTTVRNLTREVDMLEKEKGELQENCKDAKHWQSALLHSNADYKSLENKFKVVNTDNRKLHDTIKDLKKEVEKKNEQGGEDKQKCMRFERDLVMKRQLIEELRTKIKQHDGKMKEECTRYLELEKRFKLIEQDFNLKKNHVESLKKQLQAVRKDKLTYEKLYHNSTKDLEKRCKKLSTLKTRKIEMENVAFQARQNAEKELHVLASRSEQALDLLQARKEEAEVKLEEFSRFLQRYSSMLCDLVSSQRECLLEEKILEAESEMRSSNSERRKKKKSSSMDHAQTVACDILNLSADDLEELMSPSGVSRKMNEKNKLREENKLAYEIDEAWKTEVQKVITENGSFAEALCNLLWKKMKDAMKLTDDKHKLYMKQLELKLLSKQ